MVIDACNPSARKVETGLGLRAHLPASKAYMVHSWPVGIPVSKEVGGVSEEDIQG